MRGSRNFRQGGGGVQVRLTRKALTRFFFFFFFSPQLILQKSNAQFQINLSSIIFQGSRGGPTFSRGGGGGPTISRGGGGPIAYSL